MYHDRINLPYYILFNMKMLFRCVVLYVILVVGTASATHLPRIAPEQAGFSTEGLAQVDALIEESITNGFPGAVLAITRNGHLVKLTAYGNAKVRDENGVSEPPEPMRTDTLFDLASNTKTWATTLAIQHLVHQGKLDINAPVQQYLAGFVDGENDPIPGKADITVAQLLRHTSGAVANPMYYDRQWSPELFSQNRQTTYQKLLKTPLAFPPDQKNVYSDLGFMLLGLLIETITGMSLDEYVEQVFYAPLELRALFAPLHEHPRIKAIQTHDIAATEIHGNTRDGHIWFENIRTHTIQGQVHDEKAFYSLEQIAGHAGLFADAESLAVLQQIMMNGGCYHTQCFFDQTTIEIFTTPDFTHDPGYGLGWRLNVAGNTHNPATFFGRYASPRAFGHTGWTGIATLVDPEYNLGIVLLTNKKHTPVLDAKTDSNRFVGDTFPISDYRHVMEHVYLAMLPEGHQQQSPATSPTATNR